MENTERAEYWDCLRGMAMVMVIFCHVCGPFCLDCQYPLFSAKIADALMLPLFFFISGRFTHIEMLWPHFRQRFVSLVIPTCLMFIIYEGIRMQGYASIMDSLKGEYKAGYWFPFSLLMMNLIHYLLSLLVSKWNNLIILALVLFSFLIVLLERYDWQCNNAFLSQWISLRLVANYLPFYVIGVIYHKFSDYIDPIIFNGWIAGASFVLFIGMTFMTGVGFLIGILHCFLGVLFTIISFYKNQAFFSSKTFIGSQLSLIGRYTLPIYLIHYFFFLGIKMPWLGAYAKSENQFLFTLLGIVISLVVVYSSLLVRYLISISKPMYKLLLGK